MDDFEKRTKKPLSELYVTARLAVLCALVAFIVLFVAIGHNDMRAENFRYLIRYLDRSSFSPADGYSTLYYKGDSPAFEMYKGNLAVLADGELSLIDASGNTVMTDTVAADAEFAAAQNERYLVLFSRSQGVVRAYNSFSSVFEKKFSSIYSVYGFEDGFAVIAAGEGYRTDVTVMNADFRVIYTLSTDNIVTAALLKKNSLYLASVTPDVAGAFSGEDITAGEIGAFDVRTGNVLFRSKLCGMPLGIYHDGETLFTAATDGVYLFTGDGETAEHYRFTVTNAFTDGGFAVTADDGGRGRTLFFDRNGVFSCDCGSVADVGFSDGVYVLSQSAVYRLEKSGETAEVCGIKTFAAEAAKASVRSGGLRVFPLSDGKVLFCGRGSAFPLSVPDGGE